MVQGLRNWTLSVANLCFCLATSALVFPCFAVAGDCSAPTVLLNAFDRKVNIERDLHAEDIKVEVDGKHAPILSLSFDTRPRRIILMFDSSGSMKASPQQSGWGLAIPAAAYAAYVVPESASAQLVTFSDTLMRESSDFENQKVVQGKVFDLRKRQPKGLTSLFDSVHQVLIEFKELRFGDAIYLVTDGGDNKSRISRKKVIEELSSRGIRVFIFLVQRPPHTEEEKNGISDMYAFAESTGGVVVPITSADPAALQQLDSLAPQIIAQVAGVYRLEMGISEVKKTSRVKVEFVDGDRKHSTRSIVYSQEINPCSSEP
jgi:hypothetical protein